MSSQTFSSISSFLAACETQGISDIIIAYRAEWGPEEQRDQRLGEQEIDYGPIKQVRLLAYSSGIILSCDCDQFTVDEAEAAIGDQFTCHRRSRNIAKFD